MFYAHFVLAKKGPLSRIWLAAHWDKKLTKAHVFETNIEQSVEGIIQPKVKMALRTSGHLLLGVVRIYSRKAKYLLADCNEAFVKIKMAFRPGMVDLPEDNREAAMNAITLPEVFHDFDTEMPDLNDVDIQAQFSMNQTRAEEITMREDYGNINLDTGDDGFGDVPSMDPRTPEMLRDASSIEPDFGADNISFAPETEDHREFSTADRQSLAGESVNMENGAPSSMFGGHGEESQAGDMSTQGDLDNQSLVATSGMRSSRRENMGLDAPIQDDGFGGSLHSTGQSILAGGLFEDGSLFDDDVPPSIPGSERIAPSESNGTFAEDPYPGAASPGGGSSGGGGSRPPTPMEDSYSPPNSPTPSHHSVASKVSSVASYAPSQASTIRSSRSAALAEQNKTREGGQDDTTLLHNEEESFALAPVEASAIKGFTRAKRKRKLIVDEVKAISGEEMKAQLSDTSDIVTTLDLAPPTKRLMHWKETGGVEKLFALPGRTLHGADLFRNYQKNLTARPAEDELFESLAGSGEAALPLEYVKGAGGTVFQEPLPPKKDGRGRKRKVDDDEQSEYSKRQEALVRKQEESAREERERRERGEERNRRSSGSVDAGSEEDLDQQPANTSSSSNPPHPEDTEDPSLLHTPAPAADDDDDNETTPPPAVVRRGPLYPPGTPVYGATPASEYPAGDGHGNGEPEEGGGRAAGSGDMITPSYPPGTPVPSGGGGGGPVYPPGTPVHNYETPLHEPAGYDNNYQNYDDDDAPAPPNIPPQTDFTDQWVSQAANATATGAAIPPPQTPTHPDYFDDHRPPSAGSHRGDDGEDNDVYDDDYQGEVEGEDNEMQEDETIENFEDRVLNKRAAQLHRNLSKRFVDMERIEFSSMASRKNDRKQVAQKFYSLLVLQKVMACEVQQDTIFGELLVSKGPKFSTAAQNL